MRPDKRNSGELRNLTFKTGVSRYAEGSCLVKMGHTHVLCTASVEEKVPAFMKGAGKGWITAEYAMLPRSCQERIPRDIAKGRINGRSQEIQRLIGRSLRAILDFEKLGERTIWVDCDVLQGDGGTRCAAISGAYVAVYEACRGLVKKGALTQIPLRESVAAVSVGIVRSKPVMDLCYDEDSKAELDMNIVMTGRGRFVEIQGTAEKEPFTDRELKALLRLAKTGIRRITVLQNKALSLR